MAGGVHDRLVAAGGHAMAEPAVAQVLMCQPARSRTSTACVPAASVPDSSARKTSMAPVETSERTSATPVSRSGQTAPNRWAEAKRCSRIPRGRTPFWCQTWVTRPFLPDPVERSAAFDRP